MNVLRWHRIVLAGTLCALLACTAGLIVLAGSDVGTKSATRATTRVVDRALGTHERNTSLRRNPARGLEVNITPHGFTYDAGSGGTIALSGVGIEGKAQTSYANGTLRHTSFGSEAVAVNGEKAEEFLTVDKKLGPRTWRWRLDTPLEARVSDRGWVGFFDRRTNRLMSVAMPPVKIFNSRGGDATPAGLHDVVLRATPAERLNRNTGHFLELYRRSDARSRAAGRRKIRRRTHRAAMAAIDRFGHLRLAVASLKGEIERSIEPRRDAAQQREKWLDR